MLASPFIFYFVASFVFPALKIRERKYVYRGLVIGVGLFLVGVAFCYFVLMPLALAAAQMYSNWLGFGALQWRAEDYISFVCKFMLGMGLGFELPVVILTLVKIGVLDYEMLAKARRYMIVINLFLGAVLTTPEVHHPGCHVRAAASALRNHRLDRMVLGPGRIGRRRGGNSCPRFWWCCCWSLRRGRDGNMPGRGCASIGIDVPRGQPWDRPKAAI